MLFLECLGHVTAYGVTNISLKCSLSLSLFTYDSNTFSSDNYLLSIEAKYMPGHLETEAQHS